MTDRVDMGVPDFAILEPVATGTVDPTLTITEAIMGPLDPSDEWGLDRYYEFDWAMRVLSEKADVLIYLRQEESGV